MTHSAPLLVELLTEELPPKALPRIGEVFAQRIAAGLQAAGLLKEGAPQRVFAAPRRLGVLVSDVFARAPARDLTEKIMPVSVALDVSGQPSAALSKKLQARSISPEAIERFERRFDGKTETFFYTHAVAGAALADVLEGIVNEAIKALPIPKLMRWGDSEVSFVRPVHRLVFLHGQEIVAGSVLGLQADRVTQGHRFMGQGEIVLSDAREYENRLEDEAWVIANFCRRRDEIERQLQARAAEQQASLGEQDGEYLALLNEVTALVEHPTVYVGCFEAEFLKVPQECLILTMRANQKYFPLFDDNAALLNRFLIVSNMRLSDPTNIISGNQRVVRPRLADARFFYQQDRKSSLASRLPRLDKVVYHNKLGSQLQRVERLRRLAVVISRQLNADCVASERAAQLAKADLLTEMVGEFPELQGVMGRYYALHDGESHCVATAIETHYRPRFAGDVLPIGNVACALALADKLDTLVGFFGIGQLPSGDKDPFGLRRAALGVLRLLMETPLPLNLGELIAEAAAAYSPGVLTAKDYQERLQDFLFERLKNLLREAGHASDVVDAVLGLRSLRIDLIPARLEAVCQFQNLPDAKALAAANKRIVNLLRKAETTLPAVDMALLQENAEKLLFHRIVELAPQIQSDVEHENYTQALHLLAQMGGTVDAFFEQVMIMVDEPLLRVNRLALLQMLAKLMNQVADISRLTN